MKATTSLYKRTDSPSHSMFEIPKYRVWVLMKSQTKMKTSTSAMLLNRGICAYVIILKNLVCLLMKGSVYRAQVRKPPKTGFLTSRRN